MVSIPALISTEGSRWKGAAIQDNKKTSFHLVASRLIAPAAKAAYQRVEARTGVPWFAIAVIHERESSQNFARQLSQGDPLSQVSVHVPRGRGPFKSFEDGAYDALVNCAPKAARWTDWSIGGILTILEEYNGLGYAGMGRASPYIWAGTNEYASGKYTSDGHYDASAVDSQLGCAGLLMTMAGLDTSIKFGVAPVVQTTARVSPSRPSVPVVPTVHDSPPLAPDITHPAHGSIGDAIVKLFHALFDHRL